VSVAHHRVQIHLLERHLVCRGEHTRQTIIRSVIHSGTDKAATTGEYPYAVDWLSTFHSSNIRGSINLPICAVSFNEELCRFFEHVHISNTHNIHELHFSLHRTTHTISFTTPSMGTVAAFIDTSFNRDTCGICACYLTTETHTSDLWHLRTLFIYSILRVRILTSQRRQIFVIWTRNL
jgi:hypothetical protein